MCIPSRNGARCAAYFAQRTIAQCTLKLAGACQLARSPKAAPRVIIVCSSPQTIIARGAVFGSRASWLAHASRPPIVDRRSVLWRSSDRGGRGASSIVAHSEIAATYTCVNWTTCPRNSALVFGDSITQCNVFCVPKDRAWVAQGASTAVPDVFLNSPRATLNYT